MQLRSIIGISSEQSWLTGNSYPARYLRSIQGGHSRSDHVVRTEKLVRLHIHSISPIRCRDVHKMQVYIVDAIYTYLRGLRLNIEEESYPYSVAR